MRVYECVCSGLIREYMYVNYYYYYCYKIVNQYNMLDPRRYQETKIPVYISHN